MLILTIDFFFIDILNDFNPIVFVFVDTLPQCWNDVTSKQRGGNHILVSNKVVHVLIQIRGRHTLLKFRVAYEWSPKSEVVDIFFSDFPERNFSCLLKQQI